VTAAPVRPVRIVAGGGTIAMRGERAAPALDAPALLAAVPELGRHPDLEARSVRNLPGVHLDGSDALALARAAVDATREGRGAVVTTGTDTLEEVAVLCGLMHDGDPPIVVTGAIRPMSAPGADGPANLVDAVTVAGAGAASGLGAVVVFAGQVHAARTVRKVDAWGPAAFGSPCAGPVAWVAEGHLSVLARPVRGPRVEPARLDARVPVVPAVLGDDGGLLRAAVAGGADAAVAVCLGAGHVPPGFLAALREAAAVVPVVATSRAERGGLLRSTYGFEGSERDLRATGAIPAGLLSPAAARITLMACLGAGLEGAALRAAFAGDDL
jgi:L-asparaginase